MNGYKLHKGGEIKLKGEDRGLKEGKGKCWQVLKIMKEERLAQRKTAPFERNKFLIV